MYEFGPFRLDPVERTLMAQGQAVALTPKCFELLFVLVRNAGRLVDKEELMRQIWPDTFVEENNLTVNISALRKLLRAGASDQRYIQTVPRRGYRFAASVRQAPASAWPANQATARLALLEAEEGLNVAGTVPRQPSRRSATEADTELLVGREPELQNLNGFLRQAVYGAGHMVFITGEPGIGKTALSNAFLCRALATFPNITFCRGRCVEQYGVRESYLPILDSLSELLSGPKREFVANVLRSCAPTWCFQFPAVFGSTDVLNRLYRDTVGATKERMVREIVDAFAALAAAGPVLVHLEDIHWADPSTVDVLRRLSHDIRKRAILVTGTFRPEDVERANRPLDDFLLELQAHGECEEMALGLLVPEHLATYLDARFAPNRFGPELAALIHRNTEGQPLFAASLVQFFVERGDITRVSEHWELSRPVSELGVETPANVGKMIRKKIDALQPEDRRALEYASIQGEEFNSVVLASLLDTDELVLEERLHRLDKLHRLIQTTGEGEQPDGTLATRYRFRHVLYQNALYSELGTKRRVLLHRQTGDLMVRFHRNEAARIATQLALHFERGRDFERAVEFLIHAGDNARRILASDEAATCYSRAAGLVPRLPSEQQQSRLYTIYEKRGAVYLAAGQFDRAIEDFNNLLQQARATGDLRREHFALNALAEAFFYAHRLDDLDESAAEALRIAQHLGDENLRIETTVFIAMRQDIVGELPAAKRNFEEIIRVARALDNKSALLGALAWRGQLYFFQSEYERACQVLAEALQLGAYLRHATLLLQSRFFLGLSLGNLGRISEALTMLTEVSAMARRNSERYWLAKVPNCIAWIYRELGDFDQALTWDLEGLEAARAGNVGEAESNSLISLGYDRTHAAEPETALKSFREAEAILDSDVWCRWRFKLRMYAGLATHHLSQGQLAGAEENARLLLESATHYEARKYSAIAHKLLAECAIARSDLAEAENQLNAARNLLMDYPTPLVEWRIDSILGRLRLQSGDASAAEAFEKASAIVRMIASNIEAEKLRASFLGQPAVREILAPRISTVSG